MERGIYVLDKNNTLQLHQLIPPPIFYEFEPSDAIVHFHATDSKVKSTVRSARQKVKGRRHCDEAVRGYCFHTALYFDKEN